MARTSSGGSDVMSNTSSSVPNSFWVAQAFSFGGWIDSTSMAGSSGNLGGSINNGGGFGFKWNQWPSTGVLGVTFYGVADYSSGASSPSGLSHVLITINGSSAVIYLNGSASSFSVGTMANGADGVSLAPSFGDVVTTTMSEWAIWDGILSAADAASLVKAFSPLLVRREILRNYWPIYGNLSTEPDIVGGAGLSITGTSKASHPRVIMPRRRKTYSFTAAAGGGFSSAFFRENAGVGSIGGGPFARANAGLGAIA